MRRDQHFKRAPTKFKFGSYNDLNTKYKKLNKVIDKYFKEMQS